MIAVQATNQQPSSRWYSGSGIFRNVYLVATGPVHVARHGTFVTTPGLQTTIASGYAAVQVQTDVANEGTAAASVQVRDHDQRIRPGRPWPGAPRRSACPPGRRQTATVTVKVTNPALWSTDQPAACTASQTDLSVGGAVVDSTTTAFGIRYFAFDPAAGFSLNGQAMKLQGVDLHATEGAVGSAVRYDALAQQMELMKSMGVNALRTAHNPPAPELVQVCDRLGIVMMVEAFDCWHTASSPYDYHLYFDAVERLRHQGDGQRVEELARSGAVVDRQRDPGHAAARAARGSRKQLIADIKSIDTTRPVVMGSDQYRSVPATGVAAGPDPADA